MTLTLMAACVAAAVLCGWLGSRPPNPHRGPRLAPWRLLMMVFAAVGLALGTHAVNLLGVNTGPMQR